MGRSPIRTRQRLGKYRIESKLGDGGFAAVYQAIDTIEGVRVALKIPHDYLLTDSVLGDFRNEVRLAAKLKHPNILPLKNADFVEGRFVIAYPLGERTLAERLQSRLSLSLSFDFTEQMLAGVAFAHEQRIIHCDIKPENLILFANGRLMLTDFGIAKVAFRTIRASGSGTVGYCVAGAGDGATVIPLRCVFVGIGAIQDAQRKSARMAVSLAASRLRSLAAAGASGVDRSGSPGHRSRSIQAFSLSHRDAGVAAQDQVTGAAAPRPAHGVVVTYRVEA